MGQSYSAEPVVEKHTEIDLNDTFVAAVSTCQGWRLSQEDDHNLELNLPGEHKAAFFAVFDGHGSAIVSKHAAESLWRHITQNEHYIKGDFRQALEQSFLSFDREAFQSYNAQLAGTTATSVLIVDNVIYCANIGDSRSVAAINCKCVPLSHDHKPENPLELKRILAAGGYVLGNRVNGNLALSRAFGDFHYKSNEQLPADQQIVSPFPEIERIELNDDVDFVVLACDGIWDVLTSEEVVEFVISRLEHEVRPDQICEQLTTRCLATDYELVIGCDNMTVLLVCYIRGMSWSDYCTNIFEKNSKRLGLTNRRREIDSNFGSETTTFQHPNQRHDDSTQHQLHSDHLGMSSSSEQSTEATLNTTLNHDSSSSSQDAAHDTSPNRYLPTGRAMDELFHLLSGARLPESTGRDNEQPTNSDETPPISEVPTEEVVTIHDDDETPSSTMPPDSADTSATPGDNQQGEQKQEQSDTTENEETDKTHAADAVDDGNSKQSDETESAPIKTDDENMISSGTAEIKLDGDEINEDNLPDASEIEPIDLAAMKEDEGQTDEQQADSVQGTVEVELSAPDDAPDVANDEGAANVEDSVDENNELDEGITVEEPTADEGNLANTEESQDDTNNDASDDTNEGS